MKKQISFSVIFLLLTSLLGACGNNNSDIPLSSTKSTTTSKVTTSTSKAPAKKVTDLSISLGNEGDNAVITVRGTQQNYSAEEFKWAWGLRAEDGQFDDGKENPKESDFVAATFNENNAFTVKYNLTALQNLRAGVIYQIYGGTPETYGYIQFESNQFGASDATRHYYLRQDKDNDLIFDNIQPITYTKASIVEITDADLPEGVTATGAYLKLGGANSKNLTMETINAWHDAGNIAGDFQRVIPENSYSQHVHVDEERFWKIEGSEVYFYLYVGFIELEEGWMVHFDVVGGSKSAGCQTETKFNGETPYTIGGATYKIYSDSSKSGESNYWGCLGVYREA